MFFINLSRHPCDFETRLKAFNEEKEVNENLELIHFEMFTVVQTTAHTE